MASDASAAAGYSRAGEERLGEVLALVEREVLGWPGVWKKRDEDGPGGVGVTGYRLGRKQVGHVHDDGHADFRFPREVRDALIRAGDRSPRVPEQPDDSELPDTKRGRRIGSRGALPHELRSPESYASKSRNENVASASAASGSRKVREPGATSFFSTPDLPTPGS